MDTLLRVASATDKLLTRRRPVMIVGALLIAVVLMSILPKPLAVVLILGVIALKLIGRSQTPATTPTARSSGTGTAVAAPTGLPTAPAPAAAAPSQPVVAPGTLPDDPGSVAEWNGEPVTLSGYRTRDVPIRLDIDERGVTVTHPNGELLRDTAEVLNKSDLPKSLKVSQYTFPRADLHELVFSWPNGPAILRFTMPGARKYRTEPKEVTKMLGRKTLNTANMICQFHTPAEAQKAHAVLHGLSMQTGVPLEVRQPKRRPAPAANAQGSSEDKVRSEFMRLNRPSVLGAQLLEHSCKYLLDHMRSLSTEVAADWERIDDERDPLGASQQREADLLLVLRGQEQHCNYCTSHHRVWL